ncbi:MAG: hypothetical protein DPW18_02215 [Chloroflexi bacterium]|nr:hypothetical protein [Chloroflexota bacterium]MDL1942665.1 hypothetical protein [Chloroflexi bacterium CFX2]
MIKANKISWLTAAVTLIGLMFLLSQSKPAQANSIPDTPESREIMAVIEKAYQLMAYASQTFDVSEFPSVFIDTQDYKLTDEQKSAIADILGVNLTDVKDTGYLTAMQMQYISMGQGLELLKIALENAKAENRNLTAEEFREVIRANHGQMPASSFTLDAKTKLVFESITIDENRAIVRYDDGAALQEAILVKVERWFIASIVPIWIHF